MAFTTRASSTAISTINVTPLVDVLLVLLIIFMITAPVITHKVKVDLPQFSQEAKADVTEPVRLAIRSDGSMYWNDTPVNQIELNAQLAIAALQKAQPALQVDAADGASYEVVARALSSAKAQGLSRIDFVGNH
ncbi:ExbD/TolR family protein [Dyella tabacisoli]|uniref:Biopolymer transporter ExbD n=1 Tax=Dyella tabacisoli TaxID=2282381 RepID=A0A369ULY0_9GAMM|nr:biopolymer transporter ExbD [Dyella tabacisoli]RDD81762.1 biopolymer transporter ExbD [Dyella tabacisoli]